MLQIKKQKDEEGEAIFRVTKMSHEFKIKLKGKNSNYIWKCWWNLWNMVEGTETEHK